MPAATSAITYSRRRPENSALYRVVQDNWLTFQALHDAEGHPLPKHVVAEFEGYLACGILARGFARVHCGNCGHDRRVAFSCKLRGFCSSCIGRRMASTAVHPGGEGQPYAGGPCVAICSTMHHRGRSDCR